jgi:cell division protein FtsL
VNPRLSHEPRRLPLLAVAALSLALTGGTMVWTRGEVQRSRYALAKLADAELELRQEIESLRRQRETLGAPSRIERLALKQGLLYPPPDALVILPAPHDPHLAAAESRK